MLSFAEARARIQAEAKPLGAEDVALAEAASRALARDVFAGTPLPRWNHAAMDGIAYAHAPGRTRFPLHGEARAGGRTIPLEAHAAARISTGARLPEGADTVAPRELVRLEAGDAILERELPRGKHVRLAGEDLERGAIALTRGSILGAGALALLATLDIALVPVVRRPRVLVLSTGDELRGPGTPDFDGSIPDASRVMLVALARALGTDVTSAHCGDDPRVTEAVLARAEVDVILTVGGASHGDHDHVRQAIARLGGGVLVDGVAVKPGKPVGVARLGERWVVVLPGNPGAAFVTFHAFAAPLLRGLLGGPEPSCPRAQLVARASGAGDRTELLRVRLELREDGLWARPQPNQSPGAIVGLERCDGLAEITGPTEAGALVPVHLV
jgi:molybdopterin molybdotransferase